MDYVISGANLLLLMVFLFLLIQKSIREKVGNWFTEKPARIWLLPILFLSQHLFLACTVGEFHLPLFAMHAAYFLIPTALLYFSRPKQSEERGWDVLIDFTIVLLLWFPIEFAMMQKGWKVHLGPKKLAYAYGAGTAIVYALIVYSGWRKLDLRCNWSVKKSDWIALFGMLVLLVAFLTPIALGMGFAKFGILNKGTNPWLLPLIFMGMFLAPAFAEELIFRGIIQNLLEKVQICGKRLDPMLAIIIASMIFGYAHINNRVGGCEVPNWTYVLLATIAGIGYGYVYQKTRSLVMSSTLHLLVDFIWLVFLKRG